MTVDDITVTIGIRPMPYLTSLRVYIQMEMTAFVYYFFDCNPKKIILVAKIVAFQPEHPK